MFWCYELFATRIYLQLILGLYIFIIYSNILLYLSIRGGSNPGRSWNFAKKKNTHNLPPISNNLQELPLAIQNSPSKVSSRLRSSINSSTDYAMDIDEAVALKLQLLRV
jgi:hypothetical protein